MRVLKEAGYIEDYEHLPGLGAGDIRVTLKYYQGEHVIEGLRRESRPGQRRYVAVDEIPEILNGMGVSVVTTSKGVMTGKQAKEAGVGGELICSVW